MHHPTVSSIDLPEIQSLKTCLFLLEQQKVAENGSSHYNTVTTIQSLQYMYTPKEQNVCTHKTRTTHTILHIATFHVRWVCKIQSPIHM